MMELNEMQPASYYYRFAQNYCPAYPPSSTTDAVAVNMCDTSVFLCNATPKFTFQNYSAVNYITKATINVKSYGALINSIPWTGSVAPYGLATVLIPAFEDTSFLHYHFEVVVPGDSNPSNNSPDSIVKLYDKENAVSLPSMQDFEGSLIKLTRIHDYDLGTALPTPPGHGIQYVNYFFRDTVIGITGAQTTACMMQFGSFNNYWYYTVINNYNSAGYSGITLDFDACYGVWAMDTNRMDTAKILISSNCGTSWDTVWHLDRSCAIITDSPAFVPNNPSQWHHYHLDLSAYADSNMILKIYGGLSLTSVEHGYAWFDNILVSGTHTLPVGNQMTAGNDANVFPNPAKERATIAINTDAPVLETVSLYNLMGQQLYKTQKWTEQGRNEFVIPLNILPPGIYLVKTEDKNNTALQKISVMK